jgi:hypothetical protein
MCDKLSAQLELTSRSECHHEDVVWSRTEIADVVNTHGALDLDDIEYLRPNGDRRRDRAPSITHRVDASVGVALNEEWEERAQNLCTLRRRRR